jgi:2-haloacid dehalogenase/putative hydrolase of the HAD superfamily
VSLSQPVAVLWDIGNVVVRWDPRTLYSKIFPDPDECDRFLGEVCTMAWHVNADRGVTFADNIAALTAEHPHHADAIAAWWSRWPEMFSGLIPETEAAIEALAAKGVPQYGLTNMSVEAWPGVRAMTPAFLHLEDVIVSGAERLIKPDPRIFQLAADRTGWAAQQMLFIDDSAANIEAAHRLGFFVHRFKDPAALGPALERFGLL